MSEHTPKTPLTCGNVRADGGLEPPNPLKPKPVVEVLAKRASKPPLTCTNTACRGRNVLD